LLGFLMIGRSSTDARRKADFSDSCGSTTRALVTRIANHVPPDWPTRSAAGPRRIGDLQRFGASADRRGTVPLVLNTCPKDHARGRRNRSASNGVPGRIHLSDATYELVRDEFNCEPRGTIEVKGKGPDAHVVPRRRAPRPCRERAAGRGCGERSVTVPARGSDTVGRVRRAGDGTRAFPKQPDGSFERCGPQPAAPG
jgi:hypothetical protein